ncbi:MAG: CYTH domain-containing protein [Prolixibacteraceae bacterium]
MPFEIERKFLVKKDLVPLGKSSKRIVQVYLSTDPDRTVRVRLAGDQAWLTIKGSARGIVRHEFEYPVPAADARQLINLAVSAPVEKVRREIHANGKKWEVDFFEGANEGLVLAEIELSTEDEVFTLPDWVEEEVTGDKRYHNSQLSVHPYSKW